MKKLVQESQQALEQEQFGKSLKLAKEAIQLPEGKENARLHLLAGKAGLGAGAGHEDEAKDLLEKAFELDGTLMPALVKLSELFEKTTQHGELADVKLKQQKLADAKGNKAKAVAFSIERAIALKLAKRFNEAVEENGKLLQNEGLSLEEKNVHATSILQMYYENIFSKHTCPPKLLVDATIVFVQEQVESFDPNADMQQVTFPLSQAILGCLTTVKDLPLALHLCEKVATLCKDQTNNQQAVKAWGIVTSFLFLVGSGNKEMARLAVERTEDFDSDILQAKWRAWAFYSSSFLAQCQTSQARRCSDLAVIFIKKTKDLKAKEVIPEPPREKKKAFVFSSTVTEETEEERQAKLRRERKQNHTNEQKDLMNILSNANPSFWYERCVIFTRWFVQGSPGRAKDLLAAARYAKEGISCCDSMLDQIPTFLNVQDIETLKSKLYDLALETSSTIASSEGTKLANTYLKEAKDKLALGVYQLVSKPDPEEAIAILREAVPEFQSSGEMIKAKHAAAHLLSALLKKTVLNKEELSSSLKLFASIPSSKDMVPSQEEQDPSFAKLMGNVPKCTLNLPWFVCIQGQVKVAMGEIPQGHGILLKAVQLDHSLVQGFQTLGRIYLSKDKLKAIRCFEKAFLLDPKNSSTMSHLTHLYWDTNQNDLIKAIFERTIATIQSLSQKGNDITLYSKAHHDAWIGLARLKLKSEEYSEAASAFQKALSIVSENESAYAWQGVGDAYLKMGRYTASAKAFDTASKVIASGSEDQVSLKAYCLFRLGTILSFLYQPERAVDCLKESYKLRPSPISASALAQTLLSLARKFLKGDQFESSANACHEALQLECGNLYQAELWDLLACAVPAHVQECKQSDCHVKSRRAYAKEIFHRPWDQRVWKGLGRHCFRYHQQQILQNDERTEDPNRFRRVAETCIALDPTDAVGWNLLGCAIIFREEHSTVLPNEPRVTEYPVAQHCFVRSVQLDPAGNSDAWCNLSSLLQLGEHYDAANEALVLAQSGNSNTSRIWTARAEIGKQNGMPPSKISASLECAVDSIDQLATSSALQSTLEYSLDLILNKDQPKDVDVWIKILDTIHRYARRNPKDSLGQYLLGLAQQARGNKNNAMESFSEVADYSLAGINLLQLGAEPDPEYHSSFRPEDIASAFLDSGRMEMARSVLDGIQDKTTLEWHLLSYRASPSIENAKLCATSHSSQGASRVAQLAIESGRLEHAVAVKDEVDDASISSQIEVASEKEIGAKKTAILRAPWDCKVWETFSKSASLTLNSSALISPQTTKVSDLHNIKTSCNVAIMLAEKEKNFQVLGNAFLTKASVDFQLNELESVRSEASRMYYLFPFSKTLSRIVAVSAISIGIAKNEQEKVKFGLSLMDHLFVGQGQQMGTNDLLTCAEGNGFLERFEELFKITQKLLNEESIEPKVKAFANVLNGRASFAKKEGPATAVQHYQEALRIDPHATLIWIELGNKLSDCDAQAASFCYESAAETINLDDGENLPLIGSTARLLFALHLAEKVGIGKSFSVLNKLSKANPMDVTVHLLKGWLSFLMGDSKSKKNAAQSLRKVLEIDSKHKKANELLEALGTK